MKNTIVDESEVAKIKAIADWEVRRGWPLTAEEKRLFNVAFMEGTVFALDHCKRLHEEAS